MVNQRNAGTTERLVGARVEDDAHRVNQNARDGIGDAATAQACDERVVAHGLQRVVGGVGGFARRGNRVLDAEDAGIGAGFEGGGLERIAGDLRAQNQRDALGDGGVLVARAGLALQPQRPPHVHHRCDARVGVVGVVFERRRQLRHADQSFVGRQIEDERAAVGIVKMRGVGEVARCVVVDARAEAATKGLAAVQARQSPGDGVNGRVGRRSVGLQGVARAVIEWGRVDVGCAGEVGESDVGGQGVAQDNQIARGAVHRNGGRGRIGRAIGARADLPGDQTAARGLTGRGAFGDFDCDIVAGRERIENLGGRVLGARSGG